MNNYIYSLLIVSLIGGIINTFTDGMGSTKRYISYFLSLMMVICMASPIFSVIKSTEGIKDNINSFFNEITDNDKLDGLNEIIVNTSTEAVIKGIKNTIVDRFGFDENEVFVEIETDKTSIESIKITKIKVILTGKASWSDVETVKEYLLNVVGGDVSVTRR